MKYQSSFSDIRALILFVVLLVFSLSFSVTEAQDVVAEGSPVSVLGETLSMQRTDTTLSFIAELSNEGVYSETAYYGLEIRSTVEEDPTLIDAMTFGAAELAPNASEQIFFTYNIPTWLHTEYKLLLVVYGDDGSVYDEVLLDTTVFFGAEAEIEILPDSCVYESADGNIQPLGETLLVTEDAVTFKCSVVNNGMNDADVVPQILLASPLGGSETSDVHTMEARSIAAGETTEVTYTAPQPQTPLYGARLSLESNKTTNSVAAPYISSPQAFQSEEYGSEAKTHTGTGAKSVILYGIVSILALIVLLAILIYHRKQHKPLSETYPPTEGDNNLEQ